MRLTPEQRYRQAKTKARILSRRNLRRMLEGMEPTSGPATMDLEREFIIKEIERAYNDGWGDGFTWFAPVARLTPP